MQIVGENLLFNPLRELGRIIIGKGTDIVADAGADIPGSGSRIARPLLLLIDVQQLDDGLQHLIDGVHILQMNALDLKALPRGQMNDAVAVFFRDLLDHSQNLRLQIPARHADAGRALASDLADPKRVFLRFLRVDIQTHNPAS